MVVPDRKESEEGPQTALETNDRYNKKGEEVVCLRIDVAMREKLQAELMRQHCIERMLMVWATTWVSESNWEHRSTVGAERGSQNRLN